MPTTRPLASRRAPPELPGEMAASVCTRSTRAGVRAADPGMARWTPEMMPAVTEFSKPSGLPMATASCPTAGSSSGNGGLDVGVDPLAVDEGDPDLVGSGHDVGVGDHGAVLGVDDAAALALVGEDG